MYIKKAFVAGTLTLKESVAEFYKFNYMFYLDKFLCYVAPFPNLCQIFAKSK